MVEGTSRAIPVARNRRSLCTVQAIAICRINSRSTLDQQVRVRTLVLLYQVLLCTIVTTWYLVVRVDYNKTPVPCPALLPPAEPPCSIPPPTPDHRFHRLSCRFVSTILRHLSAWDGGPGLPAPARLFFPAGLPTGAGGAITR